MYKFVCSILLVVLLVGCAPVDQLPQLANDVTTAIWAAQPGTTLYFLNNAFQGGGGTRILTNGTSFFVTWNMPGSGVGFTLINTTGSSSDIASWWEATKGNGNVAFPQSVSGISKYLQSQGWTVVHWTGVPAELRAAVAAAYATFRNAGLVAAGELLSASQILLSLFVMPVGAVPTCPSNLPAPLCDGYYQYE